MSYSSLESVVGANLKTLDMPSPATILLLAMTCGLTVANLYYCQPLLENLAREFATSEEELGFISGLTLAGYATGLFFFVPLGDRVEKRKLLLTMLAAVAIALFLTALSPNVIHFAVASFILGMVTITPQLALPMAAGMAKPENRGAVVGKVLSGLLIGILLSRVVAGVIGDHLGWRAVYWLALGLTVALMLVLRTKLPLVQPPEMLPYVQLLRSTVSIFRSQPILQTSCIFGAVTFGAFSVFWTTLSFFTSRAPYHFASDTIGLFGLAGISGALIAPYAGNFADRRNPLLPITLSFVAMLCAFVIMSILGANLYGLVFSIILFDLGAQCNQISNQTRIYKLAPTLHSRINTAYMIVYLLGGTAGAWLGTEGWLRWGWAGVCTIGSLFLATGLVASLLTLRINLTQKS